MSDSFYFIKKINDQWVENIEVLNDIDKYYSVFENKIGGEKEKKRTQSRKCTDFFRMHLIYITNNYNDDFVEELKYKIKIALMKLHYQTEKNNIMNFSRKIKELGENFINDLEFLQKQNFNNLEKFNILKKLINSFKNVLNQIYIINYSKNMERYYIKKYKIIIKTGLHIGAGKDSFEIGEIDNPVIKEFETGIPYIPGSSIKGKIRFLLEKNFPEKTGLIERLFGSKDTEKEENKKTYTIILVRDGFVTEDLRKKLEEKIKSGEMITEEKAEVTIKPEKTHPRFVERVPVNYEFEFEVVFRFFDEEDLQKKEEYFDLWNKGINLLIDDYLGGSGSRGYGRVWIEEIKSE